MTPFVCSIGPCGASYAIETPRLRFRPMTEQACDGYWVARWRNEDSARAAFWNTNVVTPDSHAAFMRQKSPYDLVWLAYERSTVDVALGMAGLIIDPATHSGEAGRYYVDAQYRGQGYAAEIDAAVLAVGFDYFRLESMWLDAWVANAAVIQLHKKVGWRVVGTDVPGHTRAGGPVLHMVLTPGEWSGRCICA